MPKRCADKNCYVTFEDRHLLEHSDDDEEIYNSETSSLNKKDPNYQAALDALGFGKFHNLLLLVCGLANASDAVEILCVSLLLPAAQCDLKINTSEKGWLAAMIFVGMMVGSYIWGALGDIYGRRNVLSFALLINGVFGGLSGLAQSFWFFLLMRFISGVGVGGSIPLVWSYFAEFQPTKHRAAQMCLLAGFWMVGNITTAGLGWLIIPHYEIGYKSPSFTFNSWRIFIMCCSIFSISSALMLLCFPKSPIFLLKEEQYEEAEMVLKKIFSINNSGRTNYENDIVKGIKAASDTGTSVKAKRFSASTFKKLFLNIKCLFGPNLRRNSYILLIVNFSLAFGYYGLWLWFPELFNRMAEYVKYSGHEASVCAIPHDFMKNDSGNISQGIDCERPVNQTVFFDSFILALSNLPGVILTVLFMDKIGRKYFLAGGLITSSISIFFIWLVKNRVHNLILSSCFGGFSVVSYNALNVVSAELFPTEVRSTAMGILLFVGRIGAILGNIAFGYLIDFKCEVPILLIASLMGGSGLLCILLPNTTLIQLT